MRKVEVRQKTIDVGLVGQGGFSLCMRHDECVHAGQRRQQDAVILREPECQQRGVENFLAILAVELQPRKVPQHQRVALVRPDIPRRSQRTVDPDHDDGQPVVPGDHDVFRHVSESIRRTGRKCPGTRYRGADRDGHRAVLAFHGHHATLAERKVCNVLDDLCLRGDRINTAGRSPPGSVGFSRAA